MLHFLRILENHNLEGAYGVMASIGWCYSKMAVKPSPPGFSSWMKQSRIVFLLYYLVQVPEHGIKLQQELIENHA